MAEESANEWGESRSGLSPLLVWLLVGRGETGAGDGHGVRTPWSVIGDVRTAVWLPAVVGLKVTCRPQEAFGAMVLPLQVLVETNM